MRKFFSFFAYVLALAMPAIVSQAQTIPNAGMENWAGGDPVGWSTTNDPGPPAIVSVTQSSQSHGGTSAAQGTAILVGGIFVLPPVLISGTNEEGFPINARPGALRGWYKFTGVGGDGLAVTTVFEKNGSGLGAGSFQTLTSTTTYREFIANTVWIPGTEIPDTAYIAFQIIPGGGAWHAGTTFWIDDLASGAVGDVRDEKAGIPNTFALHQNYPNPFNPSTSIRYEIPTTSHVSLKVFNMVGQEVATLAEGERTAGVYAADFSASNLPSGTYFYRLQAGNFSQVRKLALIK